MYLGFQEKCQYVCKMGVIQRLPAGEETWRVFGRADSSTFVPYFTNLFVENRMPNGDLGRFLGMITA